MKIVEFPKEHIGFQWSWWVPERSESGPREHSNTPKAASEDQMDSWEVPGSARRRFGDVSEAHGELSKHFLRVFFNQKSNYLQFPIGERTRGVFQLEQTHEALRLRPNLRRRPLTTQWIARIPFAAA